jgi:hypothetical protein
MVGGGSGGEVLGLSRWADSAVRRQFGAVLCQNAGNRGNRRASHHPRFALEPADGVRGHFRLVGQILQLHPDKSAGRSQLSWRHFRFDAPICVLSVEANLTYVYIACQQQKRTQPTLAANTGKQNAPHTAFWPNRLKRQEA